MRKKFNGYLDFILNRVISSSDDTVAWGLEVLSVMAKNGYSLNAGEDLWYIKHDFTDFDTWFQANELIFGERFKTLAQEHDDDGYTLIHQCLEMRNIEFMSKVVSSGLNEVDTLTSDSIGYNNNRTALELSLLYGGSSPTFAQRLIDMGASIEKVSIDDYFLPSGSKN